MRAQQRNRLLWLLEQIYRRNAVEGGDVPTTQMAEAALKLVRDDEAKFAGRVPPIRPSARR